MDTELTVYIDEGGDSGVRDGLNYYTTRHEWFTVGAYVVRTPKSANAVELRDHILKEARVRQAPVLHYYKLAEDRRQQVCDILGKHPARAFCLASHKSNMREHENKKLGRMKASEFYNWCCRLLLERIMEFAVADAQYNGCPHRPLQIIFSQNKGHDYDAMFSYFENLTEQARIKQFHLKPKRWIPEMMSRKHWKAEPHDKVAGLQLADVVASSFLQGANSAASNYNPGPAKSLLPIMARDAAKRIANAGVTLWPLKSQADVPTQARPLFEFYGYRF